MADYEDAIRLAPKRPYAYVGRGDIHFRRGKYAEALSEYEKAVRLDPKAAVGYSAGGSAYARLGAFAMALSNFVEATGLEPKNPRVFNNLAWLLATYPDATMRNGRVAVAAAIDACQMSSWKDFHHIDSLAAAEAEMGDFQQAVECQREAIALATPTDPARKRMERRLGQYMQGKTYQIQIRQGPDE